MSEKTSHYKVAIDVAGTVHMELNAESPDAAYEKAKEIFDKQKRISTGWLYERNFYIEDSKGIQHEF